MAPKKKVKAKKEKGDAAVTGDLEAATAEELNQKIATLEREKNKEEEYRNYMQLERDKLNAFWEISKREVEDRAAELRNKDREMEEMEERHQVEIKVYKQKVKHLLYEQQGSLAQLKADQEASLKLQQDEFRTNENDLIKDKRSLKQELKEQELASQEAIRSVRVDAAKAASKVRQSFEAASREVTGKAERAMRAVREELEVKRKQEVHEVEERKNLHITQLMKKHEKAFAEIKAYYNDITHNNLDLIKSLKDDVAAMKRKEAANEKLMYEIAQENKRLAEPLSKALKEVEVLRGQVATHEKERGTLGQVKARLVASEKKVKNLEWEAEIQAQRLARITAERDDIASRLEEAVVAVGQRTGLRSLVLEARVSALGVALEEKETQLAEVLAAANMDPGVLQQLTRRLDQVLAHKNGVITGLQGDLAKVSKAHNDLIRVYEARLAEYGIPPEDLGFRPLLTKTAPNPAGLVAGA